MQADSKLLKFGQARDGMLKVIEEHGVLSEYFAVDIDWTRDYLKSKI